MIPKWPRHRLLIFDNQENERPSPGHLAEFRRAAPFPRDIVRVAVLRGAEARVHRGADTTELGHSDQVSRDNYDKGSVCES